MKRFLYLSISILLTLTVSACGATTTSSQFTREQEERTRVDALNKAQPKIDTDYIYKGPNTNAPMPDTANE